MPSTAAPTHAGHPRKHIGLEVCRAACATCSQVCLTAFYRHCLAKGGQHVETEHARIMADCADLCQTAANFMARESGYHHRLCGICADLAGACADSCRDMDGMQDCVAACERCAEACHVMATQGA